MLNRVTEKESKHRHLEKMSTIELLQNINSEDKLVPNAIEKIIPSIEKVVDAVYLKLKEGGRLFYIGAGTSGRLGIVDASECPPTFGVSSDLVIGIISGGDGAIRKAVEFAEDNADQGFLDLKKHHIDAKDFVIGIAASGTTPYVIGALKQCRENNIATACITCNENTPLAKNSDFKIECIVGPEFVTGSTRMKSGTAQKLILNMISTSVMIKLGRVIDNKMVDMQLSNNKLVERGTQMIMKMKNLNAKEAKELLLKKGSVRAILGEVT